MAVHCGDRVIRHTMYEHRLALAFNVQSHARARLDNRGLILQARVEPQDSPADEFASSRIFGNF